MALAAPAHSVPAPDPRSFRDAVGRFATGVAFVTAAPGVGADAVGRAVAVYDELGHDVGIWTSDLDDPDIEPGLNGLGFARVETMPGMVMTEAPAAEPTPAGATLRRVESELDRERWVAADLAGLMEGLSAEDGAAPTSAFATLSSQNLTFNHCDIDVKASRATAQCQGWLRYVPRVGSPSPRTRSLTWVIELSEAGEGWLIERVTAR